MRTFPFRFLSRSHTLRLFAIAFGLMAYEAKAATVTYLTTSGLLSGSWQNNSNWSGSTQPAAGSDLVFGTIGPVGLRTTTNNTVDFVVNSITFSGTTGTVAGGTSFNLNGQAIVLGGNINTAASNRDHQIGLKVKTSTAININAGGTTGTFKLTFNGGFQNDHGLTFSGPIVIGSTAIDGTGAVTTTAGSAVTYNAATLGGNLSIGGSFGMGTGTNASTVTVGTLANPANTVLGSGSSMKMDFSGTPSSDKLVTTGAMTWGGALALNLTGAGTMTSGSTWDLFDFNSQSGSFSSVTLTAASAAYYSGLTFTKAVGSTQWVSTTTTDGLQQFVFDQSTGVLALQAAPAVPEPSSAVLLVAGGLAMFTWRRRQLRDLTKGSVVD